VKVYPMLIAVCAIMLFAAVAPAARAANQCAAYGDAETDFTWLLCPAGEKYERQYLYFGFWSDYYKVKNDAGACNWSESRSSWVCPDKTIRCDARHCG
jgi:hypothetical protein